MEIDARRPPELTLRLVNADGGTLLLARPRRREMHRNVGAGAALQGRREIDDGRLDAGTDVESARADGRTSLSPRRV